MELLLFIGLMIVFSSISLTFKILGLGFRIFWGLFALIVTLISYLAIGILSFAFPIIAILILIAMFSKKD